MPAPTPLVIATSSVLRLLKEETSYHKELVDQEAKVKALEEKINNGQASEDGNDEYMLKQQKMAVEQTKSVFKPLRQRITEAQEKLEEQIALSEANGAPDTEIQNAKDALSKARAA